MTLNGGASLAQGLYFAAGVVIAVWTPIVTAGAAVSGVGTVASGGIAVFGTGAAMYCFDKAFN